MRCTLVFGKTCSLLPLSKYCMRLRLADVCVQAGTTQQNLIILLTILLHGITRHSCRPVVVSETFGLEADLSRNKSSADDNFITNDQDCAAGNTPLCRHVTENLNLMQHNVRASCQPLWSV